MDALLILTASPYGSDVVYHALRLAGVLAERGSVCVFLMGDATGAALDAQSGANEDTNLASRLRALVGKGAAVKVCGLCAETRGYHAAALVPGTTVSSLPELADLIESSKKVLTF